MAMILIVAATVNFLRSQEVCSSYGVWKSATLFNAAFKLAPVNALAETLE